MSTVSSVTPSSATPAEVPSRVLEAPPLPPHEAAAYFADKLRHYADAFDVHEDLNAGITGIIVVDARSAESYAAKHIPGAINVPHRTMGPATFDILPLDKVIVTYCDGIGCNGSTKAAFKLAKLGYQVKELIGGIAFWEYEGYPVHGTAAATAEGAEGAPRNNSVKCDC